MLLLAIIGAVLVTFGLVYFTLGFIGLIFISDESPRDTFLWNWRVTVPYLVLILAGWVMWFILVASKITIGFG